MYLTFALIGFLSQNSHPLSSSISMLVFLASDASGTYIYSGSRRVEIHVAYALHFVGNTSFPIFLFSHDTQTRRHTRTRARPGWLVQIIFLHPLFIFSFRVPGKRGRPPPTFA
ncbi:hypothetical protein BD779DRAFT_1522895 [Infundibulicybe gibba]|nr:hypothetical protein BD779DRAFT_1522895 [Infundibulicybe gibba]